MLAASTTPIIHARLARRNRLVGALRLVVPLAGAVVLAGLMAQIYLASFAGRFSIGQLTITPEAVAIEAPEYVGILADGSSYRVWAATARAKADRSDLVELSQARVTVNRADGVQLALEADAAQLDTTNQLTLVPGAADAADSTGTAAQLHDSVFDWRAQTLTTAGPVLIDYADGTTIRAQGMRYDAMTAIWTFERSTVSLTLDPGASGAAMETTR